jgi:hypothetical protein
MRLRVDGIPEVKAMFDRASQLDRKVDKLRRDFAYGTHGDIKRLTPAATGFLRGANFVVVEGAVVVFVNYAEYAPYVGLGTGRRGAASYERFLPHEEPVAYAMYWPGMEAQPYMRPAIAKGLEHLEGRIENLAKEIG